MLLGQGRTGFAQGNQNMGAGTRAGTPQTCPFLLPHSATWRRCSLSGPATCLGVGGSPLGGGAQSRLNSWRRLLPGFMELAGGGGQDAPPQKPGWSKFLKGVTQWGDPGQGGRLQFLGKVPPHTQPLLPRGLRRLPGRPALTSPGLSWPRNQKPFCLGAKINCCQVETKCKGERARSLRGYGGRGGLSAHVTPPVT